MNSLQFLSARILHILARFAAAQRGSNMSITPHNCAPRPAQRRNLRMPRVAEPNVLNTRKHQFRQQATLSTYLSDEAAGTTPHNSSVYRKRRPRQAPFTLEYRMQRRSGHIRLPLIAFATCLHLSARHMRLRVGFAPQILILALFLHFMPLVPGFNRLYSTCIHFIAFSARIRPLFASTIATCAVHAPLVTTCASAASHCLFDPTRQIDPFWPSPQMIRKNGPHQNR